MTNVFIFNINLHAQNKWTKWRIIDKTWKKEIKIIMSYLFLLILLINFVCVNLREKKKENWEIIRRKVNERVERYQEKWRRIKLREYEDKWKRMKVKRY